MGKRLEEVIIRATNLASQVVTVTDWSAQFSSLQRTNHCILVQGRYYIPPARKYTSVVNQFSSWTQKIGSKWECLCVALLTIQNGAYATNSCKTAPSLFLFRLYLFTCKRIFIKFGIWVFRESLFTPSSLWHRPTTTHTLWRYACVPQM